MPFFDKDKVKIEPMMMDVALPGSTVSGMVKLTVTDEFEVQAVRMKLIGSENTKKRISSGKNRRTVTQTFDHFIQKFELMNEKKDAKGRFMLRKGEYNLNVNIVLPFTAPPSFYIPLESSGHASMDYLMTVTVDIPNGFDAEVSFPLIVISALPRSVYDIGRLQPYKSAVVNSPISTGCCGCCSSEDLGFIETSAEIFQTVLCLPSALVQPNGPVPPLPPAMPPIPPPPHGLKPLKVCPNYSTELGIRLNVRNCSKKAFIDSVLIQLFISVESVISGYQGSNVYPIAILELRDSNGRISPGCASTFETVLSVNKPLNTGYAGSDGEGALPTLVGALTTNSTFLSVTFPSIQVDNPFTLVNVIRLTGAVDMTNRVPVNSVYR